MTLTMEELTKRVKARVLEASELHNTKKVYLAYSGGSDSALVIEAYRRTGLLDDPEWQTRVMSIRTGLEDKGHVERVTADIARIGLEVHWFEGDGLDWYVKNVMDYGFAYTPFQHVVYYRALKQKAVHKSIADFKDKFRQRILTLTGVRRAESKKRSTTPFIMHKVGARVTVNAIADVSNIDKDFLIQQATWWQGKNTHDCGCNWHGTSDVTLLTDKARKHIEELNATMKELGLWGYGEKPTKEQIAMFGHVNVTDEMPEDSFCISCTNKKD